MLKKKQLKVLIGLLVSAYLIIWIYNSSDWDEVGRNLKKINYWYFIPASLVLFFQFILRSWRWYFLLPKGDRSLTYARDLYDSIMLGNLASYILPLRAGEFVRPFCLSRRTAVGFPRTFVTVVIERFFDLVVVLISFAIILPRLPDLPSWISNGASALNVLAIVIFLFILASTFIPQILIKTLEYCCGIIPTKIKQVILNITYDMIAGASELKNIKNLTAVVLLSVGVWLATYLQYYVYLMIFPELADFYFAVVIAVIIALAVAAPSAPGFIGVYEAACVFVFVEIFKQSQEYGTVYGLLTHLHHYVFIGIFGFLAMLRFGLKFKDLSKASGKSGF